MQLIFDIGCHTGEDSEFYLKKGFRVVAVEANPTLCAGIRDKFAKEIANGTFTLIDKAIAEREGHITFFVNSVQSIWGTISQEMADRNAREGAPSIPITVKAIRFGSLIEQFGMPYYLKIDIEGADKFCLSDLGGFSERPQFLSAELEQADRGEMLGQLSALSKLGYTKFKLIDQGIVSSQVLPNPAREGVSLDYQFVHGSSGSFGKETPGKWTTESGAKLAINGLYFKNKASGALKRLGLHSLAPRTSWHDIHATR